MIEGHRLEAKEPAKVNVASGEQGFVSATSNMFRLFYNF